MHTPQVSISYLQVLYRQVEENRPQLIPDLLKWLEQLRVSAPLITDKSDEKLFWLGTALEKHIQYIGEPSMVENQSKMNEDSDSKGYDEIITPGLASHYFAQTAELLKGQAIRMATLYDELEGMFPGHSVINESLDCLEGIQSQVSRILGYFQSYAFFNEWLADDLKDYQLHRRQEELMNSIEEIQAIFKTFNSELAMGQSPEQLVSKIEQPYYDFIYYTKRFTNWLSAFAEEVSQIGNVL